MYPYKLCLGVSDSLGLETVDQIGKFSDAGFYGFFTEWSERADVKSIKSFADEIGMFYQSLHAPFTMMADLWQEGEGAEKAVNTLCACLRDCAANEIDTMVAHAFIGFEDHNPTPEGIENFSRVIIEAEKFGVKIALENTEGEEYLRALMEVFRGSKNVGFCFDSGHELCYNRGEDMLSLYGDRLFATHFNDNLGISSRDGSITWTDDLHLLPFDGIADWNGIAKRIKISGFEGPLTFELTRKSKPGRHDNDKYMRMTADEYIAEAYARACRFAAILKKK